MDKSKKLIDIFTKNQKENLDAYKKAIDRMGTVDIWEFIKKHDI